nr:hypothetical protein [Tanacetum cinerariifolium]
ECSLQYCYALVAAGLGIGPRGTSGAGQHPIGGAWPRALATPAAGAARAHGAPAHKRASPKECAHRANERGIASHPAHPRAGRVPHGHRLVIAESAGHSQRHPGLLQDGGRQAEPRADSLPPARCRAPAQHHVPLR